MPRMMPLHSDHDRLDARSLALHELVARKVLADPALLDKARENLRRWRAMDGGPAEALAEWARILQDSPHQVAGFLTERSETAARLRQSSPFAGILTDTERRVIHESYSARTYHPRGEPDRG